MKFGDVPDPASRESMHSSIKDYYISVRPEAPPHGRAFHELHADAMDRLERAITESTIQVLRRGTEYALIPLDLATTGSAEEPIGTTVGDDLRIRLS